jgi:toxin ParE1/3/4
VSRRVIIRNDAADDLEDISAYNPHAALRFLKAARRTVKQLAAMPGIGALRDYDNPALIGLRVMLVSGFRNYGIYYLTTSEAVIVLRVLHGARDLDRIFAPEKDTS